MDQTAVRLMATHVRDEANALSLSQARPLCGIPIALFIRLILVTRATRYSIYVHANPIPA
jgi:hypothetical protein